jgi:hypothetical protein
MTIPPTTKIIICEVLKEEIKSLIPPNISLEILNANYHLNPKKLHFYLQHAIDTTDEQVDTIILGYGLCSMAILGLKANRSKLIIPRIDDCIALFLGSMLAYKEQQQKEPGTYYLTKGWIKAGITPLEEHTQLIQRYGKEQAMFMTNLVLKNFKRLIYIKNTNCSTEHFCKYSHHFADQFKLKFEEIIGSDKYFRKLLFGPWDDDFLIIEPGNEIVYSDFMTTKKSS